MSIWLIKKVNEGYLVTAKNQGSFLLNNKHDAERLCAKLERNHVTIESLCDTIIESGEGLIDLGNFIKKERLK